MANAVLVLILLLSALAAVLAGMAVFSNNRPPDNRLGTILDDLDELKGVVNGLQKQLLTLERKVDKDTKDAKGEFKENLDRAVERIERKITEAMG